MPRTLDVVLSLIAVVALLPVMVVIAIANRALHGTVLFRQARIGRGGRPFVLLKFQTMAHGADRLSTITAAGDRRITFLGRVLRTTKLDELPQLFNVLRGEMSLVGPRALTPNEVVKIPSAVAVRVYSVRPGMTGLASLALTDEERVLAVAPQPEQYYYEAILPLKMAWESVYIQRKSLWLDSVILAWTPVAILFPQFARTMLPALVGVKPAGESLPKHV